MILVWNSPILVFNVAQRFAASGSGVIWSLTTTNIPNI
jgi:hypothetical protein